MISFIGDRHPRVCDSWFSNNNTIVSNPYPSYPSHSETNTSHTIVTKINYKKDGVTWTFSAFNAVPTINVSTALKDLVDNIFLSTIGICQGVVNIQ